jgi:signal transduction histidine kinase
MGLPRILSTAERGEELGVEIRGADAAVRPVSLRGGAGGPSPAAPAERTDDVVPLFGRTETTIHPGPDPASGQERTHDEIVRELVNAHELERRRIARDVHDVVGQALTAVRIQLEQIRRAPGRSSVALEAQRAITALDHALRDVRDLAFDIRPQILDDLGLVAACRWLVGRQARTVGYRAGFDAGRVPGHLPVEVEAACFRTLQEALTNIARHAHAGRVTVSLVLREQELVLSVGDDGVGFDARRLRHRRRGPSLGLVGITERVALVGGSVDVASRVGLGTMLIARFPIGPVR